MKKFNYVALVLVLVFGFASFGLFSTAFGKGISSSTFDQFVSDTVSDIKDTVGDIKTGIDIIVGDDNTKDDTKDTSTKGDTPAIVVLPIPQCSDNVDNDGDSLMDIKDAGCHTDGNAKNSNSYNPNDNSELSLVSVGSCGTVLTAGMPTGEQTNPDNYDWIANNDLLSGNSVDHKWVNVLELPGNAGRVVWNMGTNTNSVILVPAIDHPNAMPQEAHEITLYGANNIAGPWVAGTESTIYADGPSNWVSDNDTALWEFPRSYRYISALPIITGNGDGEIDALCFPTANVAPVANAGPDQTMTLPINSTTLDGSGSSDDGSIVSYVWTMILGPSEVDPADTISPNISGLVGGTYRFLLTVTDNNALTDTDVVVITVRPNNTLPQCSDTVDNDSDTYTDANDSGCHTDGNASNPNSYDPNDNTELSLVSLGSCGTVITANVPTGEIIGPDTYEYIGNNDPLSGNSADHKWAHVFKENDVPSGRVVWDMGTATNSTLYIPSIDHDHSIPEHGQSHEATLFGSNNPTGPWVAGTESTIYPDGPSNWISDNDTTLWVFSSSYRYISSTAGGTLIDHGDAEVDALCLLAGGGHGNNAPTANAGADQTITLPTSSTSLNGSGSTDSDGTIASYVWTMISGPSTSPNIDPSDTVSPNISGLIEGTYVFQLVVTDNNGATGTDTVTIVVNPQGGSLPQCSDGIDNDSDGLIDFPADSGCTSPQDDNEQNSTGGGGGGGGGGGSRAQCSDNRDNDRDGLVDENDPGCHSDGNANNANSYVRSDRSERDSGQVLGATTENSSCGIYVEKYLRVGYKNDSATVLKVQTFLNNHMNAGLTLDGIYGLKTEAAVNAFQIAYADDVLTPWGNAKNDPTGITYLTTTTKINNIMCPPLNLPIPSNLIPFSSNANTPAPLSGGLALNI